MAGRAAEGAAEAAPRTGELVEQLGKAQEQVCGAAANAALRAAAADDALVAAQHEVRCLERQASTLRSRLAAQTEAAEGAGEEADRLRDMLAARGRQVAGLAGHLEASARSSSFSARAASRARCATMTAAATSASFSVRLASAQRVCFGGILGREGGHAHLRRCRAASVWVVPVLAAGRTVPLGAAWARRACRRAPCALAAGWPGGWNSSPWAFLERLRAERADSLWVGKR